MAKTIQLLRKTLGTGTTYADAVKAIQDKPLSGLSAGEPVVAFYQSGNTTGVVMGISAGSGTASGDSAHGYVFYNAKTVDELIESAKDALIGADGDTLDNNTIKGLKKAITEVSAGTLTSESDVLVISSGDTGSKISLTYDDKTIKSSGNGVKWDDSQVSIASGTLYSTDSYIEDAFTVLGGQCGQLSAGTYISGGTTVMQLLKQMLVKEVDCSVVKPSVTLNTEISGTLEVGTTVTYSPSSTYTDGKFTGSTDQFGTYYNVVAGCTPTSTTYTNNSGETWTGETNTIKEGTNTWSVKVYYSDSSVTPKKNTGAESSQKIAADNCSDLKKVIGKYKWFLGCTTATTVNGMTDADFTGATTGWTETDDTTKLASTWESKGTSIFVATVGKLSSFRNLSPDADLTPNFTVTATHNYSGKEYNIYLWPITTGSIISAKDIKITRN